MQQSTSGVDMSELLYSFITENKFPLTRQIFASFPTIKQEKDLTGRVSRDFYFYFFSSWIYPYPGQ